MSGQYASSEAAQPTLDFSVAPYMNDLSSYDRLSARDESTGLVNLIVDTPKGSRNRFRYESKLGMFRLSKRLPVGMAFPYDFGFIPSTLTEDGDPLDVLLIADEPTFPGCLVGVRLLGVLEAEQTEKGESTRNDRLVATLVTPYNPPEMASLLDLGATRLSEIEHFFVSYNEAEGRSFQVIARQGPATGKRRLDEAIRKYAQRGG
jgi:inorganic pyrophosphatase